MNYIATFFEQVNIYLIFNKSTILLMVVIQLEVRFKPIEFKNSSGVYRFKNNLLKKEKIFKVAIKVIKFDSHLKFAVFVT